MSGQNWPRNKKKNAFTPPPLNKNGVNKEITYHLWPSEHMEKVGFTRHNNEWWYEKNIVPQEISFIVHFSADREDQEELNIYTFDEEFGQIYDYQYYLREYPNNNQYAKNVQNKVEEYMDYLQKNGILSGHKKGDYI